MGPEKQDICCCYQQCFFCSEMCCQVIRKGYASIHVRCTAHTLQLCANDILKFADVADMLKRCKDTVGLFYHSVVLSDSMTDTQKKMNIKTHKLKQAVPTRWNNTYEMLVRLVDQQNVSSWLCVAIVGKLLQQSQPTSSWQRN